MPSVDPSVIAELSREGKKAWPAIALSDEAFGEYLGERLSGDGADLPAADLYIACACLERNEAAAAALSSHYAPKIRAALHRVGFGPESAELCHEVLASALAGDGEHPPGLAAYTGRGSLVAWLQIVAVRTARKRYRKRRREHSVDDEALFDRALDHEDVELVQLKECYRAQFKKAFQQAFLRLTARERNLLRYELLEGMNLERIAAVFRVHRATLARWRVRCRRKLSSETRRILAGELSVSGDELDSVMRIIESQLDVSLLRLLSSQQD